jgi:hypothetical protein
MDPVAFTLLVHALLFLLVLVVIGLVVGAIEDSSASSHITRIGSDARSRIDTASSEYLKTIRDNTRR